MYLLELLISGIYPFHSMQCIHCLLQFPLNYHFQYFNDFADSNNSSYFTMWMLFHSQINGCKISTKTLSCWAVFKTGCNQACFFPIYVMSFNLKSNIIFLGLSLMVEAFKIMIGIYKNYFKYPKSLFTLQAKYRKQKFKHGNVFFITSCCHFSQSIDNFLQFDLKHGGFHIGK